jgi:endonuclease-3 related protein
MTPTTSGPPLLRAWRRIPGPPRDPVKARLLRLHRALLRRFGPQGWWPGRTPFEVSVGAVLTQHTAWTNAARAIADLRRAGRLSPGAVARLDERDLAALIRSAGTYRVKARRLKAFTRWLMQRFGGRYDGMRRMPLGPLRAELLAIPGLGPETVDAILLYAAQRPVFVADAYARRVLSRHGLLDSGATYEEARRYVEAHLPSDPALFNEFHALLVEAGKRYCRTVPACTVCPLRADLPSRAPRRSPSARPKERRATPAPAILTTRRR